MEKLSKSTKSSANTILDKLKSLSKPLTDELSKQTSKLTDAPSIPKSPRIITKSLNTLKSFGEDVKSVIDKETAAVSKSPSILKSLQESITKSTQEPSTFDNIFKYVRYISIIALVLFLVYKISSHYIKIWMSSNKQKRNVQGDVSEESEEDDIPPILTSDNNKNKSKNKNQNQNKNKNKNKNKKDSQNEDIVIQDSLELDTVHELHNSQKSQGEQGAQDAQKSQNNSLFDALDHAKRNLPIHTQIPSADSTDRVDLANTTHGSGYCYVGKDQGFRSCIKIGEDDNCMSGDIFPSHDLCINPSLRQ
jgi:penicillin-binding protein 1A